VTGLVSEQVVWALEHAFESNASDEDLRWLVERVVEAPAAHVLLSSNVFVGALRAIAIGLASSERVFVRPSRREPLTATLLHHLAPDAFTLVPELQPVAGDHLWAYGNDHTLAQLRDTLPSGVVLHAHGSGFGVFVVDALAHLTLRDFDAMALDVAAFDQQGCLSPRFVLLEAEPEQARRIAIDLHDALDRMVRRLPFGNRDRDALASQARHRETWRYLGEILEGEGGMVSLDFDGNPWGTPPSLRTVHLRLTRNAIADLVGQSGAITAVGSRPDAELAARIQSTCPRVRWSPFGFMQRPSLDGPVDRRSDLGGLVLQR
jgi:hypothetical protein